MPDAVEAENRLGAACQRFHLLLCSRWLLGHFGQWDWKRAITCLLDGLPALVCGEFRLKQGDFCVLFYCATMCWAVLVLPKLLNTHELSVVPLSALSGTVDAWGKQDGLGSCSVSPQTQKDICAVQRETGVLPPLVNLALEKRV